MPNLPISGLPIATPLQGDELFAIVQDGVTKQVEDHFIQNYMIPANLTVFNDAVPPNEFYLTGSNFDNAGEIKLSWTGGNGTCNVYLPDCTTTNQTNRKIGIISDSSFTTATRAELFPLKNSGQTLDGEDSVSYTINKEYEGITVWSDGTEWFIIQAKA